jgi:hypothetical protein
MCAGKFFLYYLPATSETFVATDVNDTHMITLFIAWHGWQTEYFE